MANRQQRQTTARLAAIEDTLAAVFEAGGADVLCDRDTVACIAARLRVPYESVAEMVAALGVPRRVLA